MFSGKEIRKIVLSEELIEKGYWIKQIIRNTEDSLENIVVEVGFGHDTVSTIVFNKLSVKADGEFSSFEGEISKKYRKALFKLFPKLKEHVENEMVKIEEYVSAYRKKLIAELDEKGFVANLARIKLANGAMALESKIYHQQHGEYIAPIANRFYSYDRQVQVGEIYYADLNPAVRGEFAGKRPVLILKKNSDGKCVVVAPISSQFDDDKIKQGNFILLKKEDSGLAKDSIVCADVLKTIHEVRLFNYVSQISKEHLNEVKSAVVEAILGEDNSNTKTDIIDSEEVMEQSSQVEGSVSEATKMRVLIRKLPQEIHLTNEELVNLAEIKIQEMKEMGSVLEFKLRNIVNQDLSTGAKIYYSAFDKLNNEYPVEFVVTKFNVSYSCGNRYYASDYIATQTLVKKLIEKFPQYLEEYLSNAITFESRTFAQGFSTLEECCQGLERKFAFVGKRANNLSELVTNGLKHFSIDDLEDIKEEAKVEPSAEQLEEYRTFVQTTQEKQDKKVAKAKLKVKPPVVKTYKVELELSDEEALGIAEIKAQELQEQFPNVKFENPVVYNGALVDGITIIYSQDTSCPLRIVLKPFTATYFYGTEYHAHDLTLKKALIKTLVQKYPLYKELFAKFAVNMCSLRYNEQGKYNSCIDALEAELALIGKRARNSNELIVEGKKIFSYLELEDITEDEQ